MTTFLTLLTTTSGIVLAITDEGKVVRKNKNKRKNEKETSGDFSQNDLHDNTMLLLFAGFGILKN